ncbi:hypothetical protein CASFOL_034364 [Castilleja foliolosa]|uniref:Nudix hydrolase domain-containing protein n=1 Tax=Castilleja foliolosa TaxID=1961234 RepID=A0ABD3BWP3_9LAMI
MGTLSYSSSSYSILHKQKHSPPLQLLRLNYPTVRINVNSTASSSTSNYSQMSRKVIHAMITAGSRRHRSIKNGVSSSKLHNEQRCLSDNMNEAAAVEEEHFDILTKSGKKTGITKPRSVVHRDGDYHRAVHVWVFAESTQQLLLQKRADCKDSWAGLWDISCAGHISAGDSSLVTARRELQEELGIKLPNDAFELLFVFLQERFAIK